MVAAPGGLETIRKDGAKKMLAETEVQIPKMDELLAAVSSFNKAAAARRAKDGIPPGPDDGSSYSCLLERNLTLASQLL